MGRRTYFRMARSLSQAGKGFRSDNRQRRCLGIRRPHPNPHPATRKSLRSNANIMSRTLRDNFSCWLSKEIVTEIQGLSFKRILCFEPTTRDKAPELVRGIFQALAPFTFSDP